MFDYTLRYSYATIHYNKERLQILSEVIKFRHCSQRVPLPLRQLAYLQPALDVISRHFPVSQIGLSSSRSPTQLIEVDTIFTNLKSHTGPLSSNTNLCAMSRILKRRQSTCLQLPVSLSDRMIPTFYAHRWCHLPTTTHRLRPPPKSCRRSSTEVRLSVSEMIIGDFLTDVNNSLDENHAADWI